MGAYDTLLHVHDKDHPDIHALLRGLRQVTDAYGRHGPPRVLIGEAHIYDFDKLATYYGAALDELHLPFNFSLLKATGEARQLRQMVDAFERALPPGAWPNYVAGNHDEVRLATRLGPAGARLVTMLLLTLRGTPTLYYGDELGLEEVDIPPGEQQDPWGLRVPGLGRDGCRTPMPWSAEAPHAGFSTARPWLPLNPDWPERNVAAQLADEGSMLNLTRRLLALRRHHPALHGGAYAPLDGTPHDVFAFTRTHGADRLVVALNFSDAERQTGGTGEVLASTHAEARAGVLRAWEGTVARVG